MYVIRALRVVGLDVVFLFFKNLYRFHISSLISSFSSSAYADCLRVKSYSFNCESI